MALENDRPEKELKPDWDGEIGCREPTNKDLAQLCRWLNEEDARYVIVGGFAIRAAGYLRRTMDVDLLVEVTNENEARVYRALAKLPDGAANELTVGEVSKYGVVRVGDEIMVDLMKSGCGVTYADAIEDACFLEIDGTKIPFASPPTLWRMKQTLREKDVPDRLFLRQWAESEGVTLDPAPSTQSALIELPSWLPAPLRRLLLKWFGAN